jgi:hypothetical protein
MPVHIIGPVSPYSPYIVQSSDLDTTNVCVFFRVSSIVSDCAHSGGQISRPLYLSVFSTGQ